MDRKDSAVSLKEVMAEDDRYLDILLKDALPVLCVHRETGRRRGMSFRALYQYDKDFWQGKGAWSYFLTPEVLAVLQEKAAALKSYVLPVVPVEEPPAGTDSGPEDEAAGPLTKEEHLERLGENRKRLDGLASGKTGDIGIVTEVLVDTARDTVMTNRAVLLEAVQLGDDEAKKHTQNLVDSTQALVHSSIRLITPDIFNDELMNTLVAKSNGTVIQHMTRVFLNGLAFLSYYNELVTGSSVVNKLRIAFEKKYRELYRPLLPHLQAEDITLERVFHKGMRAVSEKEFVDWATGFLVHDIGKASSVEYHEGESAYNRDIVVEHVKIGYTAVMHKTQYPRDAGLITGYHHEYYGDSGGYGYYRAGIEQHKKNNPGMKQDYCISYELAPVQKYQPLGYFPAKALEILDVYDSITDPNRKYRKAMSREEALDMMQKSFIEEHRKIDPILFDIFAGFVRGNAAG